VTGKLIAILVCATLYTVVRYLVFGQVSAAHLPVYILNKSLAMATVILLSCAALNHFRQREDRLRFWGSAMLHCLFMHALFSLAMLSPAYYPRFFGPEKMNLTGETTVLMGVLAAYCFWLAPSVRAIPVRRGMCQLLGSLFVAGHLVAMDFREWLDIAKWHGGLPPVSLVSLVFAAASVVLLSISRENLSSQLAQ
jgi:hypothetical protein